ncbi:DEAD/DEAH box helicase [Rhodocaloribacter sp.]
MITFKALGLSREIINGILDAGYTTPTSIQAQAIPVASEGRDLIGCAQTGTGKTAAFVLPMLSRLQTVPRPNKGRSVRALVVTPTRELALQVEAAVRVYGKHTRFRSLAIYGGVGMHPQLNGLRRGVDIVVATPGRLLDHLRRGSLDLSKLEILVLDEADRMLDMGFLPDIRRIVAATPEPRQTMLFSATMPGPIRSLAETIMDRPALIEVGERRNPAETVTQQVCMVQPDRKMDLLFHLLQTESMDNVLIFSRTKHRADRIKRKLGQRGFSATVLHSNRSQSQRQRALSGFKNGQFQIMVATDIAARGIDVESISHVINYDTPNQAEDYIHRIGRTGRARTTGDAITFVAADERSYLRQIERHTGQRLTRKVYDGFEAENEDEPIRIESSRRNNHSYPRNGRRRPSRRR